MSYGFIALAIGLFLVAVLLGCYWYFLRSLENNIDE